MILEESKEPSKIGLQKAILRLKLPLSTISCLNPKEDVSTCKIGNFIGNLASNLEMFK